MRLLTDALEHWAATLPDRTAFVFLKDGEIESERIDFASLARRARSVAAALGDACRPGDRALLAYGPGIEFVVAFLGAAMAGVIGVPVPAPEALRPTSRERLAAIANDARPAIVLTERALAEAVAAGVPARWMATDQLPPDRPRNSPAITGETLALLQYTSGSTTAPRGVMISHANLAHNSAAIAALADHHPDSVIVSWLPHFHDMGLIGGILQTLQSGALGVLFAPSAFLRRPLRWLEAVTRFRATSSPAPNTALELCLRRRRALRQPLELGSLKVLCNGAEPVRAETLRRFNEAFEPSGFRNSSHMPVYGLAEATLLASGGPARVAPRLLGVSRAALAEGRVVPGDRPDDVDVRVGCGRPLADQELVLVDPASGVPSGEHRVGEIWLRGPSVAQGYWQRPDDTEACFEARLADGRGGFLRTGDRGFLHEGELYIAGRMKNLIIVAGRNLHAEDVENTVENSHASVRLGGVAAFAIEHDNEEKLVVVAEVERNSGQDRLELTRTIADAIRREHQAPVHAVRLVAPGSLARTSSGKLQRGECRAAFLAGEWKP